MCIRHPDGPYGHSLVLVLDSLDAYSYQSIFHRTQIDEKALWVVYLYTSDDTCTMHGNETSAYDRHLTTPIWHGSQRMSNANESFIMYRCNGDIKST